MKNNCFALLASLAITPVAFADIEIHTPAEPLYMPVTSEATWTDFPDNVTELFDIRLPPEQQPSAQTDGNIVMCVNYPSTSSTPGSIGIFKATRFAPDHVHFAWAGTYPDTVIRYWCSQNFPVEYTIPYGFMPGDTIGPSTEFFSGISAASAPLFTVPGVCGNSAAGDLDYIGDSTTIGIAIDEPDGRHYGWITLRYIGDSNEIPLSHTVKYQVLQYAYETDPDVPVTIPGTPCPADTNGDGALTPADFTAWVAAFNANAPECDQNDDGACTPADFTAWVANFNAGC